MHGKPSLFLLMFSGFVLCQSPRVVDNGEASADVSVKSGPVLNKPEFIRVAFAEFPPWSFQDTNGQQKGILVDFFSDLSESIGIPLKVEIVRISRLHHFLSHGKLDLFVARMTDQAYDCCRPLYKVFDIETVIIGRKSGPPWTPSPHGEPVICRTGLSGYSVPGFRMFDAGNLNTCMRMVKGHRLDYMVGERYSLQKVLSEQPPEIRNSFANPVVWQKAELHLFISKQLDQSSVGSSIHKALLKLNVSNYITRYLEKKP